MNNVFYDNVDHKILIEVENELEQISGPDLPDQMYHSARRLIKRYISSLCVLDEESVPSLPDAIEAVISCAVTASRRNAALFILRMAGTPGVLPEQDAANRLKRIVVQLIEKALPDLAQKINLDRASQTYEKYEIIRAFHAQICEQLSLLSRLPTDAPHILASQKEIMRAISNDKITAYLNPYDLKRIKASIGHIFGALREITEVSDSSFGEKIIDLEGFVNEDITWANAFPSFLNRNYYSLFLATVMKSLRQIELDAKDRFVCELKSKRLGKDIAEKHYPLHDIGRLIRVSVMLTNTGPGVALNVIADIGASSEDIQFDPRIEIGDIAPGDYPLSFEIMPGKVSSQVGFTLMLSWLEVGRSERKSYVFDLTLVGQNPKVDWKKLANCQPYSTEVAEGDEFIGRASKVVALSSRLLMDRMGSSFITGQKRVGKTSLARAVERKVKESGRDYESLYLDYGQYSRMDPVETVEALGHELAEFMLEYLPSHALPSVDLNFRGSLAPLNKIADILVKEVPSKRFVLILDEFDEIHPEMYRHGALAETFFSNLRTLSAKKNIAFLLVGGEKMPFVMSAQGHKLNKFVSEGLDYFVRGDEWDDYKELVTRPVRDELNWSDSAIQRVFDLTNGHPYYTKLLCAKVFSNAVQEHDSEITESDVKHSSKKLVSELDSNVFAHLWKDGISEDRERAEVLELHRRRVLSACARAIRARLPLSYENVVLNKSSLKISDAEVISVLNDFMRRGIFIENKISKQYDFSVPLFERWLEEVGITRLMSDSLSEEYESNEQRAEDQARISSAELVEMTDSWQLYRGKKIGTEEVRAWLEQVPRNRDQRLLFKLLQNLRFVSKLEIRESLENAHSMLREYLPAFIQEKRSDRRNDVLITWVDGPGKSGNTYASLYAEDNKISAKCLIAPGDFSAALLNHENNVGSSVAAVVLVDDFIGTGNSLSKNLTTFVEQNNSYLKEREIRFLVVAVTSTQRGSQNVRDQIARLKIDGELFICEPLEERYSAFGEGVGFWATAEEKGRAKELCQRLGAIVHKTNPLGYGNQGLLLVFPETCPNNSLPILHCDATGQETWRSLFTRPKN